MATRASLILFAHEYTIRAVRVPYVYELEEPTNVQRQSFWFDKNLVFQIILSKCSIDFIDFAEHFSIKKSFRICIFYQRYNICYAYRLQLLTKIIYFLKNVLRLKKWVIGEKTWRTLWIIHLFFFYLFVIHSSYNLTHITVRVNRWQLSLWFLQFQRMK